MVKPAMKNLFDNLVSVGQAGLPSLTGHILEPRQGRMARLLPSAITDVSNSGQRWLAMCDIDFLRQLGRVRGSADRR